MRLLGEHAHGHVRFEVTALALAAMCAVPSAQQGAQQPAPASAARPDAIHKQGHSRLGEAFNVGPRERPSRMTGIGSTHFPITTSKPEVQAWFDQGHTLLHSFWFFEAERTFRWAIKLDPEAPMPYWGLARASDGDRAKAFWREADRRKAKGSARERAYIDAWGHLLDASRDEDRGAFKKALERIVITYPDDVEAKALLALETMGDTRVGTDLLTRQVLAAAPDHPGAHHYRIHNWDDHDGAYALDSCRRYGELVPGIGHALHMPGHVYAGLGMYHEAAISLDAATRAEIAYMGRQMVFPYNTWNYAHNRNYLSYVQEQLGLPSEAIRGARELLWAPLDPELNDATRLSPHLQGVSSLARTLVKFERWDEILREGSIPWGTTLRDKLGRTYVETLAHLGKGDVLAARKSLDAHAALKALVDDPKHSEFKLQFEMQDLDLRGSWALARGEALEAVALLTQAAPKELELRGYYDDPPIYPYIMWTKVGQAYLHAKSPTLAADAFARALKAVPGDPFAIAGLAEARHALGERDAANEAFGRLSFIWRDAEPGLRAFERVRALGLQSEPIDTSPGPQRNYRQTTLTQYGPAIWQPFATPSLSVRDAAGKPLSLDQFKGRNVILVFYLGVGCAHCVTQLKDLSEKADQWSRLDADVVAVSQDPPEVHAASLAKGPLKVRLGSDTAFENARRFKSYDDFEEMPIHSTILIDKQGRIHWARHGGDPFTDYDFLASQLRRMNERATAATTRTPASTRSTSTSP